MRYVSYEDIKKYIHNRGVSVKLVLHFMRISPKAFRHRFDREIVDDTLEEVEDAIKEAIEEAEYRRKLGMPARRFRDNS